MNKKRVVQFFLLAAALMVVTIAAPAQWVHVLTTDSSRYEGTLLADSATFVILQSYGDKLLISRDRILRIEYPPPAPSLHRSDKFLKGSIVFGGTIGTPGGLNFIAGGYAARIGYRALDLARFPRRRQVST
ncbi:MAG: hypothetical protein Q8922_14450 [Bacteroidota bacterium]|nr:hypothetical protein [Bacteroidota bacterium]MDP4232237.1 hypothetical protein [Bacteroidota bacterium]MDP4243583.1 hypothetical protein [Bacteroidota bacterium]MDP4289118.1 hypothetical protein [Bacteroidota bacterium]